MSLILTLSTWTMGMLCLGLVYLILNRYFRMARREDHGISGPEPMLLLGNLKLIGEIMHKNGGLLYNVFEVLRDRFGSRYGIFMGPKLFIVTEELEDIREILVKKFENFTDRQEMDFLSDSLRDAIVNQKGQMWRHSRAKLSPAFSTAKIRAMSVAVHQNVEIFLDLLHDEALNNNYFDIYDLYKRLTLSVISDCAFGFQSDCLRNSQCDFAFHAANYFRQMPSPENSVLMGISVVMPELAPICEWLHCRLSEGGKSEAWLSSALNRVIERRIQDNDTARDDVISLLIDSELPPAEIVNNAFAFLLAGYETTSTALGFATWLLGKHGEAQEKLFAELQNLVDDQKTIEYYDQVMRLPYLNAVYKEVLRLYPPITFFVNRTCVSDCEIGGVRYTKGTQVGIPIWNLHRNPKYWPNADEFRPERFLPDQPQTPFTWLPFGAGPRHCVGQRFAEMEFKIVLARTISQFRISLSPEIQERLELTNATAMLSTPAIPVLVSSRKSKSQKISLQ